MASSVKVTHSDGGGGHYIEHQTYGLKMFEFGAVKEGLYKGGTLVRLDFSYAHVTGDLGDYSGTNFLHAIRLGNRLVCLTLISDTLDNSAEFALLINKLSLDMVKDEEWTIPALAKPTVPVTLRETPLNLAEQLLEETAQVGRDIGTHPLYGSFYEVGLYFHVRILDGSILSFYALPNPDLEGFGSVSKDGFVYMRRSGKGDEGTDVDLVYFAPKLKPETLKVLWKSPKGTVLYIPKSPETDPRNLEFYKVYQADYQRFMEWHQDEDNRPEYTTQLSREAYIKRIPFFYWQDAFGRWVKFHNAGLKFPDYSEPLIYLYSPVSQQVRIALDPKITMLAATPAMDKQGWLVDARPDGLIYDFGSQRTYPSLFWEGKYAPVDVPHRGWVVARNDLTGFFLQALDHWGLNEKEKTDFIHIWVPRLRDSPYCLIDFLDEDLISRIAPISVNPLPDTMIRVYMNFKPLEAPIDVPVGTWPSPKIRKGLVFVEWGGLVR